MQQPDGDGDEQPVGTTQPNRMEEEDTDSTDSTDSSSSNNETEAMEEEEETSEDVVSEKEEREGRDETEDSSEGKDIETSRGKIEQMQEDKEQEETEDTSNRTTTTTTTFRSRRGRNWRRNGRRYGASGWRKAKRTMKWLGLGLLLRLPWTKPWRFVNYYRVHLTYFVLTSLIGGFILNRTDGISYLDGLFMTTSAQTQTGLITVDTAALSQAGQAFIAIFILMGNMPILTLMPVLMRLARLRWWLWQQSRKTAQEEELQNPHERLESFNARAVPHLKHEHEYAALKFLAIVVPAYIVTAYVLGTFSYAVYTAADSESKEILDRNDIPNPMAYAVFHCISAFGDAGYSTLASSMIEFQKKPFVLMVTEALALTGNTMFPVLLWVIIFICLLLAKLFRRRKLVEMIRFLLKQPRKVYTHLFPFRQTLFLLAVLIVFNVGEATYVAAVDWSNPVYDGLDGWEKVYNAVFHAIMTRTAGFNSVVTGQFSASILALTIILMYISATPLYVAVRSSAEGSLVVSNESPTATTAKRVLFQDSLWVAMSWVFICLFERDKIGVDPLVTPFSLLFEVVSAYGTVGLSLGGSGNWSLSGNLRVLSRLTIIVVMLMGKHRGIPESIDMAVQVEFTAPSAEQLQEEEEEEEGEHHHHHHHHHQLRNDDEDSNDAEANKV